MEKDSLTKRYMWVTTLNVIVTFAEFVGGLLSGSLALLSDAVHNLSDVGAIVISFIAHLISKRSRNRKKTFGYERIEILAAFTNGIILIVISLYLFFEAIGRFWHPEPVHGTLMLSVAIIGLIANVVSMLTLHKRSEHNLNAKSTMLHMMSDALSSLVVVVGGVVIMLFKINWLDPVLTILVSIFVLHEALEITEKAANILMESNPNIDLDQVNEIVLGFSEIKHIHHVHVWRYSDDIIMLDAHLNVDPNLTAGEFEQLCHQISKKLKVLGINHINLQAECERGRDEKMIIEQKYGK